MVLADWRRVTIRRRGPTRFRVEFDVELCHGEQSYERLPEMVGSLEDESFSRRGMTVKRSV